MDHKHLEREVVDADRDDIKPSGWFPWMTVAFVVFVFFLGFLKYADAADGVIEINVSLGSTLTGNTLKNNDRIELSLLASEAGS